jgi:hypothetical protein
MLAVGAEHAVFLSERVSKGPSAGLLNDQSAHRQADAGAETPDGADAQGTRLADSARGTPAALPVVSSAMLTHRAPHAGRLAARSPAKDDTGEDCSA